MAETIKGPGLESPKTPEEVEQLTPYQKVQASILSAHKLLERSPLFEDSVFDEARPHVERAHRLVEINRETRTPLLGATPEGLEIEVQPHELDQALLGALFEHRLTDRFKSEVERAKLILEGEHPQDPVAQRVERHRKKANLNRRLTYAGAYVGATALAIGTGAVVYRVVKSVGTKAPANTAHIDKEIAVNPTEVVKEPERISVFGDSLTEGMKKYLWPMFEKANYDPFFKDEPHKPIKDAVQWVEKYSTQVYYSKKGLIWLGNNNVQQPKGSIHSQYEKVFNTIYKINPDIELTLVTTFVQGDEFGTNKVNTEIEKIAAEKRKEGHQVNIIHWDKIVRKAGGAKVFGIRGGRISQHIHPDEEGYKKLAQEIFDAWRELNDQDSATHKNTKVTITNAARK